MICLHILCYLYLTESVVNVDDHLAEIFLEEREPTLEEIQVLLQVYIKNIISDENENFMYMFVGMSPKHNKVCVKVYKNYLSCWILCLFYFIIRTRNKSVKN